MMPHGSIPLQDAVYKLSRLGLELDMQASPRRMRLARLLLGLMQSLDHGQLHLADALAQ